MMTIFLIFYTSLSALVYSFSFKLPNKIFLAIQNDPYLSRTKVADPLYNLNIINVNLFLIKTKISSSNNFNFFILIMI
jgi:hypothetical protein